MYGILAYCSTFSRVLAFFLFGRQDLDPDPNQHQGEKSDPDPHRDRIRIPIKKNQNLDPDPHLDPHQSDMDLQH